MMTLAKILTGRGGDSRGTTITILVPAGGNSGCKASAVGLILKSGIVVRIKEATESCYFSKLSRDRGEDFSLSSFLTFSKYQDIKSCPNRGVGLPD
jgi:hypothetical protein